VPMRGFIKGTARFPIQKCANLSKFSTAPAAASSLIEKKQCHFGVVSYKGY